MPIVRFCDLCKIPSSWLEEFFDTGVLLCSDCMKTAIEEWEADRAAEETSR